MTTSRPSRVTTREFHRIANRFATVDAVLHSGAERARTVVVYTHPRSQTNLTGYPCPQLATHGVDALAFNNRYTNSPAGTDVATVFEEFALDVAAAVEHARGLGYRHVLLMGWSAGGPMMAFYQLLAEHGNDAASERALSRFHGFVGPDGAALRLPPADGLILRSITIGTAASFLIRLDGAVVDEATGRTDPELDMYRRENGWDPATGEARYEQAFLRRYYRAQALRMNRLVDDVLQRVEDIDRGRGRFVDDDFIVIPRTRANPTTVDLSLARRGSRESLLYPGGVPGVVEDTRPINAEFRQNPAAGGAAVHKLRALLSYRLIRVDPDRFDPLSTTQEASGIDFASSNSSTPTCLARTTVPVLLIQGSADESNSVKTPTAELNAAASGYPDTTLAFVAGGMHAMLPADPRFGDTRAIATAAIAEWVQGRFDT